MNYLREFVILCICIFLGVITRMLINFPIPETVYGMIYLFIALKFKILAIDDVKQTCDGILQNLAILFVPVGAAIMTNFDVLRGKFLLWMILIIIGTSVTMTITGLVVQVLQNRSNKKEHGNV
ncbi:MAG: CidA/LrgA family protein [Peptoniphilaceae bacterium]|nr:CidA/LrgA family protein [Peptoniphilaceae bacterium]MDY6019734.1 CidA/LrgA family protein [Anaerococcus sp.]